MKRSMLGNQAAGGILHVSYTYFPDPCGALKFMCVDWMNRTDAIMIELHDRFRPGCKAAFLDAARRFGFEITQRTHTNIVAQRT